MKVENQLRYIADDGQSFANEFECVEYERRLQEKENNTSYWQVWFAPDLTEGRGLQRCAVYELYYTGCFVEEHITDFCYKMFGNKVAFVQGVAETNNWILNKITKESFNTHEIKNVLLFKNNSLVVKI